MSEALKRAKTMWPRATVKSLGPNPMDVVGDERSITPGAQSSTGTSDIHFKKERTYLTKKPPPREERPKSGEELTDSVVTLPLSKTAAVAGVGSEDNHRTGVSHPRNKIYNQHIVPTARALNQSIVITLMCVWELYESIELCDNQGTCQDGKSSIICRRKTSSETQDCLFVVKEQRWSGGAIPRHCVKPRSSYLVDLHSAFFQDNTLWTLYEEMDVSLEQIFELDCDPWTIDPGNKDRQISAISFQVCYALHNVFKFYRSSSRRSFRGSSIFTIIWKLHMEPSMQRMSSSSALDA